MRKFIADIFYKIAIWIDPSLPRLTEMMLRNDMVIYGTSIVKRIDPREFFEESK